MCQPNKWMVRIIFFLNLFSPSPDKRHLFPKLNSSIFFSFSLSSPIIIISLLSLSPLHFQLDLNLNLNLSFPKSVLRKIIYAIKGLQLKVKVLSNKQEKKSLKWRWEKWGFWEIGGDGVEERENELCSREMLTGENVRWWWERNAWS